MKKEPANTHAQKLLQDLKNISATLKEEHAKMDVEDPDSIQPNALAIRVLKKLDPKEQAPLPVRMLAHASLVHMAGGLCANVHRHDEEERMQSTMFDAGLQPRYPVERDGEIEYVKRALMTVAERRASAARLLKESIAKAAHSEALNAETDSKLKAGYFNDEGVPLCAIKADQGAM